MGSMQGGLVTQLILRSFTEFILRLFTSFRVTYEGFRMTTPPSCHSEQQRRISIDVII